MPALGPPDALSPRDWNAIVDYDEWDDLFTPDDGVALHHGGGSDYPAGRPPFSVGAEIQQLQQWEGYHLYSKGWRGLAYGWAVGQTGTIYRIRGWARYGAHTGDVDGDGIANNDEIVPVIVIGSGHHHTLTLEAKNAIVRLRRFIEEGSPEATYLYGHKELKGTVTSCPGPNFMAYVRNHRLLEDDMPLTNEDIERIWQHTIPDQDNPGERRGVAHALKMTWRYSKTAAAESTKARKIIEAAKLGGAATAGAIATEIGQRLIGG